MQTEPHLSASRRDGILQDPLSRAAWPSRSTGVQPIHPPSIGDLLRRHIEPEVFDNFIICRRLSGLGARVAPFRRISSEELYGNVNNKLSRACIDKYCLANTNTQRAGL